MPGYAQRTCKTLKLDLEAARAGKTWLLLPEGFRGKDAGATYPLPTQRAELAKLVSIYLPPRSADAGAIYLRRALRKYKDHMKLVNSAVMDVERRRTQIRVAQQNYQAMIKEMRRKAREAVEEVRLEAEKAAASLDELFELGRKGIEGQMRAHLEGRDWKGEHISASAFRNCFRMVTQTVRGLGLPTEQRKKAADAILAEVAESLRSTQEAISLAKTPDTEH